MEAVALANAGATVLAQSAKVSSLRELDAQDGLPSLLPVDLELWRREPGILPAADHLAGHIANDVGEISKEYDSSRRGSEIRSRSNVAKASVRR